MTCFIARDHHAGPVTLLRVRWHKRFQNFGSVVTKTRRLAVLQPYAGLIPPRIACVHVVDFGEIGWRRNWIRSSYRRDAARDAAHEHFAAGEQFASVILVAFDKLDYRHVRAHHDRERDLSSLCDLHLPRELRPISVDHDLNWLSPADMLAFNGATP